MIARNSNKLQLALLNLKSEAEAFKHSVLLQSFSCDVTDAATISKVFGIVNYNKSCDESLFNQNAQNIINYQKSGKDDNSSNPDEKEGENFFYSFVSCTNGKSTINPHNQQQHQIQQQHQPVDILINCAGVCICDEFDVLTSDEIAYQLNLNVCGSLYPSREVSDELF